MKKIAKPELNFDFKNWYSQAIENSKKLIETYKQINNQDRTNVSYNKNATQLDIISNTLDQALLLTKRGTDLGNYALDQAEQTSLTTKDLVAKFLDATGQVITYLRGVCMNQNQLKQLSSIYKTQDSTDKIFNLYTQYSMEALANLSIIPEQIQGINYRITIIGYDADNLREGYSIDFLGMVGVPDYFFVGGRQIDLNKMLKQPVNDQLNNIYSGINTGAVTNDPVAFVDKTIKITQNSINNSITNLQDDYINNSSNNGYVPVVGEVPISSNGISLEHVNSNL